MHPGSPSPGGPASCCPDFISQAEQRRISEDVQRTWAGFAVVASKAAYSSLFPLNPPRTELDLTSRLGHFGEAATSGVVYR